MAAIFYEEARSLCRLLGNLSLCEVGFFQEIKLYMKNSKFTNQQIISILEEAELGAQVGKTCHKHGIQDATYNKWKTTTLAI